MIYLFDGKVFTGLVDAVISGVYVVWALVHGAQVWKVTWRLIQILAGTRLQVWAVLDVMNSIARCSTYQRSNAGSIEDRVPNVIWATSQRRTSGAVLYGRAWPATVMGDVTGTLQSAFWQKTWAWRSVTLLETDLLKLEKQTDRHVISNVKIRAFNNKSDSELQSMHHQDSLSVGHTDIFLIFTKCYAWHHWYAPAGLCHHVNGTCPGTQVAPNHRQLPQWLDCKRGVTWIMLRIGV